MRWVIVLYVFTEEESEVRELAEVVLLVFGKARIGMQAAGLQGLLLMCYIVSYSRA